MVQVKVYIDVVDRWCLAQDAPELIGTDRLSDNGLIVLVETQSTVIEDIQDAVMFLINSDLWQDN